MMGQLRRRAARRRNDKDIEVAVAVAREGNPFSVGRETRVSIARFVDRQTLNVLAVLIGSPNVAKISERDAPVRVAGITNQLRFPRKDHGREGENEQTNR